MAEKVTSIEDEKIVFEHAEHAPADLESNQVKAKKGANTQLDDAARLLAEAGGHFDSTPEDKKRVLRMIDIYVCIPMCIIYFIQQVICRLSQGISTLTCDTDGQIFRVLCRCVRYSN